MQMMSIAQVARLYKLTIKQIQQLEQINQFPKTVRIGLYRTSDILKWINKESAER